MILLLLYLCPQQNYNLYIWLRWKLPLGEKKVLLNGLPCSFPEFPAKILEVESKEIVICIDILIFSGIVAACFGAGIGFSYRYGQDAHEFVAFSSELIFRSRFIRIDERDERTSSNSLMMVLREESASLMSIPGALVVLGLPRVLAESVSSSEEKSRIVANITAAELYLSW